ncbi:polyphosphate kinase [Candidatus Kinetoplastibacterium blastocrithidii TCC012E]|uniref:Polyphosphate kinase n=1 Tax=Candidatus Kinetoplastidibacterium blastocrithidiae TCC012E TaxID=1208922 RepID=M1LZV5_9PROT|nr:polyphosphate kinase 1 [Candidatus Kinetoplastibacterium blastocrithidii]AGF49596.1 polyphosphate kinase [Candidatus Kinetoplastibacterium blastocrithidii TCC012E]
MNRKHINVTSPLLDRELSFLRFNERVLCLAEDQKIPLLERLKYICIVSLNIDEFFEIRVSDFKDHYSSVYSRSFQKLYLEMCSIVQRRYVLLYKILLPELESIDVRVIEICNLNKEQLEWAKDLFVKDIKKFLSPILLNNDCPFPRVSNKCLVVIANLAGIDSLSNEHKALIQVPSVLPKLIKIPSLLSDHKYSYVLLDSLLIEFVEDLFPSFKLCECNQFRITRNSNFLLNDNVVDLRQYVQGSLLRRDFGSPVRLEIDSYATSKLELFLQKKFSISRYDTYRIQGVLDLSAFIYIYNSVELPYLKFSAYKPSFPKNFSCQNPTSSTFFSYLMSTDILLHHPYQSFRLVIDFLMAAAIDPNVIAIKQTVYRTGDDSELMKILLIAAKMGKKVTVVLELMARFDEQTNINWSSKLEKVGARVMYGVLPYKTHAKMTLILRHEQGGIKKYVHLSTGNYHQCTADYYTDFGLLTSEPKLCEDIDELFLQLTGSGTSNSMNVLLYSPFTLYDNLVSMIREESVSARNGKKSVIMAKMNALVDPSIINELYKASHYGVKIYLIVRGVCALRSGIENLSENIVVRSIVGRFLEHSRAFYFYSNGEEKVYLSSADWMGRNFFRRIEIAFPIKSKDIKKRIIEEAFLLPLMDNQFSWDKRDYNYIKIRPNSAEEIFSVQNSLINKYGI